MTEADGETERPPGTVRRIAPRQFRLVDVLQAMILTSIAALLLHYVDPMRLIIAAILAAGSMPCLVFPVAAWLIFLREWRNDATLGPIDWAILFFIGSILWTLMIPEWMFSH